MRMLLEVSFLAKIVITCKALFRRVALLYMRLFYGKGK